MTQLFEGVGIALAEAHAREVLESVERFAAEVAPRAVGGGAGHGALRPAR